MTASGLGLLTAGTIISAPGLMIPSLSENPWSLRLFKVKTDFYPLLTPEALMLLGGAILLTLIVRFLCTKLRIKESNPVAGIGRISLTVFISHVFIKQLVYAAHLNQSFTEAAVVFFTVLLILFYAGLEYFWKRSGYRFGAEWLLRLVKK